jgi:dynein heavy chain
LDLASDLESKLPEKLDVDKFHPYHFAPDNRGRTPSLTIFMQQEIDRFNKLLSVIIDTLTQLKKGIKGLVVMSEDLEKMYRSFLNNQVSWNSPDAYTQL